MGQYWKIANLTKKEVLDNGCEGIKLLEFCYTNSKRVITMCNLLATRWKGDEVVVVGDYTQRKFGDKNLYEAICKFKKIELFSAKESPHKFFYNHAKKEFVDLSKCRADEGEFMVHPLVLLLAGPENNDGGYKGDLCKNAEYVGRWTDDVKQVELTIKPLKNDYAELVPDFFVGDDE